MSSMDLGTARGRIILDPSGAVAGAAKAQAATSGFLGSLQRAKPVTDRAGKAMLGMGAVAAAGIGLAVKTAAGFEQKMNKVGAVSGATGEEFEKLSDLAKELGSSTQFSASQAAEGMSFLSMAGFETKEVMEAMPGVLDLAAAGNMELARASDIASNVLTGYGLEAKDINRVNDTMAATASSANTSVEQLGSAMSFVAPVAAASGLAIEETSAVIGKLSDAGIQGSRAGTTLRQIIAKLEKPTTQGAEAIERLGVKTHDAEGSLLSMTEIVENFEKAGLSTADSMAIFGARAGPGMQALVKQGSDGLKELNGELAESQGRAKEMAERQMEGLNGALTELKSAVEGALIAVGEQLTPFFERLADAVTKVFQWFAKLPDPIAKFIAIGGAVASVVGILGGLMLLIIGRIPAMVAGFKALGITMKGALIGTGVGAIVLAIAAGLYLLYQRSETFREAVHSLWSRVQGFVDILKDLGRRLGLFQKYMKNGADASTAFQYAFAAVLPDAVVDAFKSFVSFIQDAWPRIQQAVQEFVSWLEANFLPFVITTFEQLRTIISSAFDAIKAVVTVFINIVTGFWERFGEHIISAAVGFLQTIMGFFKGTFDNIKQFIDGVLRVIQGIFDVFAGIFTGDWSRVWGGIQKIFTGVWSAIHAFLSQIIQTIISVFRVGFEVIRTAIGAAMAAITQIIRFVWNAILTFFKNIWNSIVRFFRGQLNKIKSEIRTALGAVQRVWNSIWNSVTGFVSRAWNRITSAVRRGARSMLDYIRGIPGRIMDRLGDLGSLLFNAGKNLLQGLVDGIKSIASAPVDAVKGVVSSVRNLLPFSPAKDGPLKDNPPDEAGRTIGEMIAEGIKSSIRSVEGAAFSLAESATIRGDSAAALSGSMISARGRTSPVSSNREENIHLNGDLVLPNVRNGDDAQDLLDGLRQAARQGGNR